MYYLKIHPATELREHESRGWNSRSVEVRSRLVSIDGTPTGEWTEWKRIRNMWHPKNILFQTPYEAIENGRERLLAQLDEAEAELAEARNGLKALKKIEMTS